MVFFYYFQNWTELEMVIYIIVIIQIICSIGLVCLIPNWENKVPFVSIRENKIWIFVAKEENMNLVYVKWEENLLGQRFAEIFGFWEDDKKNVKKKEIKISFYVKHMQQTRSKHNCLDKFRDKNG